MRRLSATIGSAVFFVIVPGSLAGLVPWWITRWGWQRPLDPLGVSRILGLVLLFAGVAGLIDSFARFVREGLGTPAPVAPPERLVIGGLYRHVRNPMYVCVVASVLGQGLLLGDIRLIWYGALLWVGFTLFVIGYEEPTLRSTFGDAYASYCKGVRRWVPRLRPWTG